MIPHPIALTDSELHNYYLRMEVGRPMAKHFGLVSVPVPQLRCQPAGNHDLFSIISQWHKR